MGLQIRSRIKAVNPVSVVALIFGACLPLGAQTELPTLRVGPGAAFQTVQAAVDAAPPTGATILLAAGTYREKVHIEKPDITLVGTGKRPQETEISWGDSAKSAGGTFKSGTITVAGNHFRAENLSVLNTWWDEHPAREDHSQAVALQIESDRAVLDRVRLVAAQDTLYANSAACHGELTAPCRADRQFFNDCYVEGNVDYIFGEAKAVFDHCEFHSRPGWGVMVTAQSRHSLLEDSSYTMLHCSITGVDDGSRVFLGRPWRDYATVLFYDTRIEQKLDPAGWSEGGGRLKTATYREYKSSGVGAAGTRSVVSPPLSAEEEKRLTPSGLLAGEDGWDPEAEVRELRKLH